MRNVRLSIDYTEDDARDKFSLAVDSLAHEMGVECLCKSEQGEELIPLLDFIRAKYTEKMKLLVEKTIRGILKSFGMLSKASEDDPFIINGHFIISPEDGHTLTMKEWKKLMAQVSGFIDDRAANLGVQMASEAAIAGIIAPPVEASGQDMATAMYSSIMPHGHNELDEYLKLTGMHEKDFRVSLVNLERTADYCTGFTNDVKMGIKNMVRTAVSEGWRTSKLRQEMFDMWGHLNRDWDRIARTEINDAYSNGYLEATTVEAAGEKAYLIGRSSVNACGICQRDINGVVALLTKGPVGESDVVEDEYASVAVWPGKNSIGHTGKERWTAVTRHPHCGCRFGRYYPGG